MIGKRGLGGKEVKLFAGREAETAPRGRLEAAEGMVRDGFDPRDVFAQTGVAVGPDGARWEIDDSQARLRAYPEPGQAMTLREALDHPALFEAYPDLANALLVEDPSMPPGQAAAWRQGVGAMLSLGNIEASGGDPLDFLLHELQHGIQFREGWQPGAALSDNNYRNTQGEIEAYDTQERRPMTAEERSRTFPQLIRRR